MKLQWHAAAGLAALISATLVAGAASASLLLDFESQPDGTLHPANTILTEGGGAFEVVSSQFAYTYPNIPCSPVCASNNTITLTAFGPVALSRADDGLFDFLAFDAGTLNTTFGPTTINLTGYRLDNSTVSASYLAPDSTSFASFNLSGFSGLARVEFTSTGGVALNYFQLDNLLVSDGSVPEPSTWALMIGGFGLAGAALRRRRSVIAA